MHFVRCGLRPLTFLAAILLGITLPARSGWAAEGVLTFEAPQTAGISGFRTLWDTPVVLAEDGATEEIDKGRFGKAASGIWSPAKRGEGSRPGAIVFDAVHRSLLVRFPGCAGQIASRLAAGEEVAKAELILTWSGTELWPEGYDEPVGMSFLGEQWKNWQPRWHAVAWGLKRPWKADPLRGPTFNAFMKGTGFWGKFGAQDPGQDRVAAALGPAEVSAQSPEGRLDVTDSIVDDAYGATVVERLRRLEACGFLVRKLETYDAALWQGGYEWQTATGPRGILVRRPRLIVTFKPTTRKTSAITADEARALDSIDVDALAAAAAMAPPAGRATASLPADTELKNLAEVLTLVRPAGMPDWQWARIEEMVAAGGARLFPQTREAYEAWIDRQLARAPRSWRGFDAPEVVENCLRNAAAMPEPVRDHWKLYWSAWLHPDRSITDGFEFNGKKYQFAQGYIGGKEAQAYFKETGDWRGNFSVYRTYCHAMGTMNFNNWCSVGVLGGGLLLGNPLLIADGRHGVAKWPLETWTWYDGSTQESIDHYYFAESLTAEKVIQDIARDPVERIVGENILCKSVEELASAYHPSLRRFISTSGRTGIAYLLGIQDGTMHVVHSLSKTGVWTDVPASHASRPTVTATNVEQMPVFGGNVPPGRVGQQAAYSPWAPAWMTAVIDEKPLPYRSTNSYKMWGKYGSTPLWKRSYLGRDYGLATLDVSTGNETVPFMAQWRRDASPVRSLTQVGTLIARAGINRTELLDSIYHGTGQLNPSGVVGTQGHTQFALQHDNKAIVLTSPTLKLEYAGGRPVPTEITSLQTTLGFLDFSGAEAPEIWLDGTRQARLPVRGKYGQRILVRDGTTYMAILPIPATDLGRDVDFEIVDDGVLTEMQGGGKAREAYRINLYSLKASKPLDAAAADWKKIDRAYGGFVIEIGDESTHGSFEDFRKAVEAARSTAVWNEDEGLLHVSYSSGGDLLECGFNPAYEGGWNTNPPTTQAFPYRRVNGQWPYNPREIDRDTTLTQQGTTGKLEKNGAVLSCEKGKMAYLVAMPSGGTVVGFNPFVEPVADWSLSAPTPAGPVVVSADGKLGIARVAIRASDNAIDIDYGGGPEWRSAGLASRLLVTGMAAQPRITVNGKPPATPPAKVADERGDAWAIGL